MKRTNEDGFEASKNLRPIMLEDTGNEKFQEYDAEVYEEKVRTTYFKKSKQEKCGD